MKRLKNITSRPTAQELDSTNMAHHYGKTVSHWRLEGNQRRLYYKRPNNYQVGGIETENVIESQLLVVKKSFSWKSFLLEYTSHPKYIYYYYIEK
jgi:hypothetical protein